MTKTLSTLIAAGALAVMLAPSAQAFTPAPLGVTADIELVAGGCGVGFHRGPYGGCRRNNTYGAYVAGPVVVAPVCRRVWVGGYGWRRVCR